MGRVWGKGENSLGCCGRSDAGNTQSREENDPKKYALNNLSLKSVKSRKRLSNCPSNCLYTPKFPAPDQIMQNTSKVQVCFFCYGMGCTWKPITCSLEASPFWPLPEDTKCGWWVKQGEPAPCSSSIRIIPQEPRAPCQLQGAAPLNEADLFSCKFNRAYENQVAVPAEEGSK